MPRPHINIKWFFSFHLIQSLIIVLAGYKIIDLSTENALTLQPELELKYQRFLAVINKLSLKIELMRVIKGSNINNSIFLKSGIAL